MINSSTIRCDFILCVIQNGFFFGIRIMLLTKVLESITRRTHVIIWKHNFTHSDANFSILCSHSPWLCLQCHNQSYFFLKSTCLWIVTDCGISLESGYSNKLFTLCQSFRIKNHFLFAFEHMRIRYFFLMW